jgi:A/G-specific adenine glycosylase
LANQLLDKKQPGQFNQAIMDFGAVVCKPAPLCEQCPFRNDCFAYLNNKINELPVKEKKVRIKSRWFYYLVIEYNNNTVIRQRTGKDIWQQLFEFPMIETDKEEDVNKILATAVKHSMLQKKNYELISVSPLYKQQLSHQLIAGRFILLKLKTKTAAQKDIIWIEKTWLKEFAFPKLINTYLSNREAQALI